MLSRTLACNTHIKPVFTHILNLKSANSFELSELRQRALTFNLLSFSLFLSEKVDKGKFLFLFYLFFCAVIIRHAPTPCVHVCGF